MSKLFLSLLFVASLVAQVPAKSEEPGVVEKISEHLPNLELLHEAFERAKDSGVEGYEKFVDALKDQRRKIDEYYHPQRKTWGQKAKEQYEGVVDTIKDWNCKAEEKIHELRFGTPGYSCEERSWTQKNLDKAGHVAESAKDTVTETIKDVTGYEDLESAFNTARAQGTEGLKELVNSIKGQRTRLEGMYNDVLSKAAKNVDTSTDSYKEWKDKFEQSAEDSLRKLREMGDDFEERIQDFMGNDQSQWGWFAKFKFW